MYTIFLSLQQVSIFLQGHLLSIRQFQFQSESSSREEEQEDILFEFILVYFISFDVLKIRCFDDKKIALFWF